MNDNPLLPSNEKREPSEHLTNGSPDNAGDGASPPESAPAESLMLGLGRGLADATLRSRARWAGGVLALAPLLLPAELAWGQPLFLWEILPELPAAASLAVLSPCLAGVVVLALSAILRRASDLAVGIIATLIVNVAIIKLGASAAAWDVLALPESLTTRFSSGLVAEALAGASIALVYRRDARVPAQVVVGLSAVAALWFYCVPIRGELPITTIMSVFLTLPYLPDFRFVLGHLLVAWIALIPLGAVATAAIANARPPRREPRVMAPFVTFLLPGVLLVLAFRNILLSLGDSSLLGSIAATLVMIALLALISSATVVVADAAFGKRPLLRSLLVAAGVGTALVAIQWWIARPAPKGVDWQLASPQPVATRLFAHELPEWDRTRARWVAQQREAKGSTQSAVELQKLRRTLLETGRDTDPKVELALKDLLHQSKRLDLAGRRWFRLVENLNTAIRQAQLPYYVDPRVLIMPVEGGLESSFYLTTYRVEGIRPATARKQRLAVLHVQHLGGERGKENRLLGLSRDAQPFALVDIDMVAEEAERITAWRDRHCDIAGDRTVMYQLCQILTSIELRGSLHDGILKSTERHELQHQIDGPELIVASAVLHHLPNVRKSDQGRVNREVSAYLAEMTSHEASPKLGLMTLATTLLQAPTSSLYQVGVLCLSALAGEELTGPLERLGEYRAARTLESLNKLDDDELRLQAKLAWRRLFRRDLVEVELGELESAPGAKE